MRDEELQQVIEALLFVATSPLSPQKLSDLLGDIKPRQIQRIVEGLNLSYQREGRSFRIQEIAGGYQFFTLPHLSPWVEKLFLETLAIIAYRGPINRPRIEAIRGVTADGVLKTLLERGLIRIKGRENSVGRPLLYEPSKSFLAYFGLKKLSDLPGWKELSDHGQPEAKQISLPDGRSLQKGS